MLQFKSAVLGEGEASIGKSKVGMGAKGAKGSNVHCAVTLCVESKSVAPTSIGISQRAVVEKFMVKKFDDGKSKEEIVKECEDLFIN